MSQDNNRSTDRARNYGNGNYLERESYILSPSLEYLLSLPQIVNLNNEKEEDKKK
jgi:hypothetical protein